MRARRVGRRGRPTRVSLYVDARAVVRETTRGDGDDGDDDDDEGTADETWKTFARRALARAVDGRRCEDVRFRASAFDWTTAPHAFEGAVRRGNAARGGGGDGFRACGRDAVARALVDVEDACVEYARAESGAMASRANAFVERRGALDAWMKNLTRYVGAAMVDFSEGGGFATAFADDDEDAGGESQGVLFIVVPLPEVTAEEMRTIDPERVAATFKRVEEQFERERVRAHLVYVGAPPTGVVARCLREVFRKLRGAVVPLDAATKIAAWTPLYSALDALGDDDGEGVRRLESRDTATSASTSAVDLVVETRGSSSLRLGEAHKVGERDRGDGVVSIVGFVDRVDAPSTTLATESQTIMFFDDSPVRALMAMLALKDAVAIVRRDARRFHQLAVLEPLTCSSFSVTSFKSMARVDAVDDDDDDGGGGMQTTREDAMASTAGSELDALMARGRALESLESVRALLARIRDDVARETTMSPLPTQTTQTTQDSLALTQHTAFTASGGSQPRDEGCECATTTTQTAAEARTLAEAFAADAALGVRQCASRLESWYGAREYAPRVSGMLARVEREKPGASVSEELIKSLDARFKTMLKNQHVVVSPPRQSKARRSLASTLTAFSMDLDATPWVGDVDAAARAAYDDIAASFAGDVEPNAHDGVAELAYRFRLSATDCADDALVERLERALVVDFKTLQSKYVGSAASKNAKRREFTFQMHVALRVAAIKVELARDAVDADSCDGVEERAMSKKEQKKLVKGVKKLVDEISFLLTPPGQEGVRALVESEFAPHYAGALPSTLQALQSALGVSSEAPPSAMEDASVALTPFSPQPLRRSPRKPKPRPHALPEPAAQKPKPPPRLPQESYRGFNARAQRRQITVQMLPTKSSFAKPTPRPPRAGGGTSRNLMKTFSTPGPRRGGPTVVASTPVLANSTPGIVRATPAARADGVVEMTPNVGRPFRQFNAPTPRRLGDALDTPAPKRSRFLDS